MYAAPQARVPHRMFPPAYFDNKVFDEIVSEVFTQCTYSVLNTGAARKWKCYTRFFWATATCFSVQNAPREANAHCDRIVQVFEAFFMESCHDSTDNR